MRRTIAIPAVAIPAVAIPAVAIPAVAIPAVLIVLSTGCRESRDTQAPAPEPAQGDRAGQPGEEDEPPSMPATRIRLLAVDDTPALERPVDMSTEVGAIAEVAAREAGFTIAKDGHATEVHFQYEILADGRSDPRAERGQVSWDVEGGIRVTDRSYGLAETFQASAGDRRPFVRGALPDLRRAFRVLLAESAGHVMVDMRMQIQYRDADAEKAIQGLGSADVREQWAAMRRLGELRTREAVPQLLELLDGADELTVPIIAGVLGRIGDERAVSPLARLAEGPDTGRVLVVVGALSSIGGKEARRYLELIGASHPSSEVRDAVKEILEEEE